MSNLDDRARSHFSDEEISVIGSNPIKLASGDERDAIRLAHSWAAHIDKIDRDRSLPWSDRTVWNEFDYCAALTIRDHLDSASRALPAVLRDKVYNYVLEDDERFMSITTEDSGKRMAAVASVGQLDRGWWWYRVPDSGPIVEDLARWNQFEDK